MTDTIASHINEADLTITPYEFVRSALNHREDPTQLIVHGTGQQCLRVRTPSDAIWNTYIFH